MTIIRNEANQPQSVKETIQKVSNVNIFSRNELEAKLFWTHFDSLMQHVQSLASFMDYAKMPEHLGQVYLELISNNLAVIKDLLFATYGLTLDTTSNSNLFVGDYNNEIVIGLGFWAIDYQPELERIYTIASKWINYDISPNHFFPNHLTDLYNTLKLEIKENNYNVSPDLLFDFSNAYAYAPYYSKGKVSGKAKQQLDEIDNTIKAIFLLIVRILSTPAILLINYDLIVKDFRKSRRGEKLIQGWRRDYSLPREQLLLRLKEKSDLRPWVDKCCLLHEGKIQKEELFFDSTTPSSQFNKEKNKTSNWLSIFTISAILQEYEEYQNSISAELPETSPQVTPSGTSRKEKGNQAVDIETIVKAAKKCEPFMWGNAALTAVFCVCRDVYHLENNMSLFEKQMQKQGVSCPDATLSKTMSNNPYMKLHIDKWKDNGAKGRVLILVREFKKSMEETISESTAEQRPS